MNSNSNRFNRWWWTACACLECANHTFTNNDVLEPILYLIGIQCLCSFFLTSGDQHTASQQKKFSKSIDIKTVADCNTALSTKGKTFYSFTLIKRHFFCLFAISILPPPVERNFIRFSSIFFLFVGYATSQLDFASKG